jgi:hypothetical protein
LAKPRPQGHVRVRLLQLTRGGEWWLSFCRLAGGGECGCRFGSLAGSGEGDSNVARGDAGRRLCSIARGREQGCSFQSVAGTCVSFDISKELLDTVPLGKQTLDEEVIGQTVRTRAEPLPPARDLVQSVVAALDHARLCYIAATVVLQTGFRRAAVI